jgi:hypothetical protein
MALGSLAVAASPDVWVAALCACVLGIGNGAAVACNALLVQRGTFDLLRGRALTFVMSITYVFVGVGLGLGGAFIRRPVEPNTPRWIWAGSGVILLVAAVAGALLARNLGSEGAAEPELSQAERTPVAAAN